MAGNLDDALAHYGSLAAQYDDATRLINGIRQRAVAALQLVAGETVLDAGCGTGYCFTAIQEAIGPTGRLIGFEPSPQMLAIAHERVRARGWTNAQLLHASGHQAELPHSPDAVLFSYTHDMIRSPKTLEKLFAQCKPGARVACTSTKLYAPWFAPANWWLRLRHKGYITDFEGMEAPWSYLAEYLDDFQLKTGPLTQHYIATGCLNPAYASTQATNPASTPATTQSA